MNTEVSDSAFISSIFIHIHKLFYQTFSNLMKLKKFNNYKKDNIIYSVIFSLIILKKRKKIIKLYVIN